MPNDTRVKTRIQDHQLLNPSSVSVSFPSLFFPPLLMWSATSLRVSGLYFAFFPILHFSILSIFLHASLADGLLSLRMTVCVDTHALVQHVLWLSSSPCLLVILLSHEISKQPSGIYWLFIKGPGPPNRVKSTHCTDVMKVNNDILPLS